MAVLHLFYGEVGGFIRLHVQTKLRDEGPDLRLVQSHPGTGSGGQPVPGHSQSVQHSTSGGIWEIFP